MKYSLICPHCKHEQLYVFEEGFQRLLCYPEDGGCDEYFAILVRLVPEVTLYKLKVADENVNLDW